MSDGYPFIILEADVRLYTVDGDGNPLTQQWIGAKIDRAELEGEFVERRIEYPGRSRAFIYHEDERWRIVLRNVRTIDFSQSVPRLTQVERNVEYALVIVWWDKHAKLWAKRCYFGVKAQPAAIDGGSVSQILRFSAEEMAETGGYQTVPDFTLLRTGEVWYVNGGEQTLLYTYSPVTRAFTPVVSDPSRAVIDASAPNQITISIGGVVALVATSSGVSVGQIDAEGGTFLDDSPRLEFWVGSDRCASLSAAALVCPDIIEVTAEPSGDDQMDFLNPGWLFTIANGISYAPAWNEFSVSFDSTTAFDMSSTTGPTFDQS